jgi:putative aldouronate transport system permease protein
MNVRDTSWGSRLFDKLIILLMIAIVCVTLFPFYHIAVISLSNGNAVLRGEVKFFPVGFTLDAYRLVMEDPAIPRALMNSVIYTTVGTLINLVMTVLCAYPLARTSFSGRTVLTWMVAFTMLFSGGLIPLYLLVMQLGLLNSMWALVLPVAINPWFMFILRTSFKDVDESIYEAALIDGANDLQILWRIAVPLAKPTLATLLLFYAVAHWNEFFYPLIFLDDRTKYPIQLIMRNIVLLGRFEQTTELGGGTGFAVIEQTLKYATIMVSTLPILAVYPFVQKYFVKGVMVGAIKG